MKDISRKIYRVRKPRGRCAVWTMVPFWSPSAVLKYTSLNKTSNVRITSFVSWISNIGGFAK